MNPLVIGGPPYKDQLSIAILFYVNPKKKIKRESVAEMSVIWTTMTLMLG